MSYSSKQNVNTLTALLVAAGVRQAVVCPGSRNAPIVHNLNECPDIMCHPVTDERCAGFYALGMALSEGEPVAVCVTSGTALLNLAPAVAEAYYQHVPLVVISADRPPQWIDQLDGQTLPQVGALGRFVVRSVSIPEVTDAESQWYCSRLIRETLLEATNKGGRPVHINVPLTEPLYQFDVEQLPRLEAISRHRGTIDHLDIEDSGLRADFWSAKRPMIVMGQNREGIMLDEEMQHLMKHAVVLYEPLGSEMGANHFDEVLAALGDDESLMPDFVLYGGMVVSKRLKQFLRKATDADFWEISPDGRLHDTFMHAKGVLEGGFADVLLWLEELVADTKMYEECYERDFGELADTSAFVTRWQQDLERASMKVRNANPPYSQMAAVKALEDLLGNRGITHYANSMSVRLANLFARHYVYCNRGVNGIEGSLSTAAGFSLMCEDKVFCVIGDLSFFYDSNGLWQDELRDNLRILLLNNGGGGIFEKFEGLNGSAARERFVMAKHHATAAGICESYGVQYRAARNMEEMKEGIDWLVNGEVAERRPLLLEVFTDSEEDMHAMQGILR